jgi:threonine/homoserine/homoserine lactone efflux protein
MVITPGPGVLACVSRALTSGFKMSVFVIMGIITGDVIFVIMALYGLSAIAEAMGSFFIIVRYLGAMYLIWLGYLTWTKNNTLRAIKQQKEVTAFGCYISGFLLTLGNPKVIVFYLSILPAFLDPNRLSTSDVAITLVIVVSVLATVLLVYSLGASRLNVLFHGHRAMKNIDRCSGGAMISAGLLMLVKK